MLGYRVPDADKAMLISGGKQNAEEGGQFRIVTGHGAWVMPLFRKVRFLSLQMHQVDFAEKCYTNHGITINVSAVVAFKIDNHPNAITAAAQRFLNDQGVGQMEALTTKIFVGHLRGICGRMTVEEIIQNRERLTEEVLDGSQNEMSAMGLHVDSLQIETFDDVDGSYIVDMAKPQRAAIKQAAEIAQAKADQAAQAAQQESERAQAEQLRNTATARAQYKSEMDKANAEAEAAGQLAKADVDQRVREQQQAVAETQAVLTEKELIASQIKPAEAEAKAKRISADAETSVAEAAAKRAQFEAEGRKTMQIKQAEAQAQQVKLQAEASAAQVTVSAQAARDAATYNAEAIQAQGMAEAKSTEARGLAEAKAIEAKGLAEAKGQRAKADAVAANDKAMVELRRTEMLPEIARAVAQGVNLGGANLYVANGAEGLVQLGALALPIIQQVMGMFSRPTPEAPADTLGPLSTDTAGRQLADLSANGS